MELCRSAHTAIQPPAAAGALRPSAAVASVCRFRPVPLLPRRQLACSLLKQQHGQLAAAALRRRLQRRAAAAAAAATAAAPAAQAAASAFWPALVQAWNTNPAAVLLAAGACILGVSLSIFLLAAIPTMLVSRWAGPGGLSQALTWRIVACTCCCCASLPYNRLTSVSVARLPCLAHAGPAAQRACRRLAANHAGGGGARHCGHAAPVGHGAGRLHRRDGGPEVRREGVGRMGEGAVPVGLIRAKRGDGLVQGATWAGAAVSGPLHSVPSHAPSFTCCHHILRPLAART